MRLLFLTILFSSLFLTDIQAQTFPTDREDFVREFDRSIRRAQSSNLRDFTRDSLGYMLNESDEFPEVYFEKMVETSNLMLEKRLKLYPEVYNYVYSVYTLVKEKQPQESYDAWHDAVDKMLNSRNTRRFRDFIEISGEFFTRNVITINPNFEWYYIGGDYEFSYERTPFMTLKNGTLICKAINRGRGSKEKPYTDSVKIEGAEGVYDMLRERFEGKNGKIFWEKAGLDKKETYAELTSYKISMKSTNFKCDTVSLTTPYFDFPVKGNLIDRARRGASVTNETAGFPRFQSFEARYEIPNFIKDVDYKGGFALEGGVFVGEGSEKNPAELLFYNDGKSFIRTYSSRVNVSPTKLSAENCGVNIYVGVDDSIYHPGLNFAYMREDEQINITRGSSGISQSPFVNSYHKLNMYVEEISWRKNADELQLGFNFATSQQQREAKFESFAYYDEELYQRIQAMEGVNPLGALYNHAYKYDEYTMSEGKAATALNRAIQQAKRTLLELSALGFISYDTENGIVSIMPKLEHFVMAKARKTDFDNISFSSDLKPIRMDNYSREEIRTNRELKEQQENIKKRNREREKFRDYGTINLGALDLKLKAVDVVTISEGKNTQIFPDNNEIVVKKNRNIDFQGWLNSGKWEIHVEEGNYEYEKHGFNIFNSDAAVFRCTPFEEEHGNKPIPLQSTIEGIQGELIVDHDENRSGLNPDYTDYPKLFSREKTRVHYNQRSLFLGAYEKKRFYFEIDPFELDSLATFNEEYVRFSGELTSAGIFPKIREDLKVMNDYSLGFSQAAPEGGYEFYGTEAKYENKILLSNNGLQGGGTINFVNSSSTSKNLFNFLPDSTVGVAEFVNHPQEEGIEFPDVNGPDAYITFVPKEKVLRAKSNNELLSFFDGDADLRGTALVKEEGMTGRGLMEMDGANMTSKSYRFSRWVTESETAQFNLDNKYKDPADRDEDPLAFKTDNVTANVDFNERKGEFTSNDGSSTVEFPVNKYICKIDMFTWMMDEDDIEMQTSEDEDLAIETDLDLVGPNFFSIHPKQDSLQFKSPKATFSLKEKTIYCDETKFIDVADARIFPDSSRVVIRRNAKMDPLENSKIVANYITKYHTIDSATTKITARRAYTAEGYYPYFDIDSNKYDIYMPEVRLDTSYQTVAFGEIKDDEGFMLSDYFEYYGKISIKAADPTINFEGATRIQHECENFERNWMSFEAPIDRENVQIPVSENMTDLYDNPISAGIMWRHSQNPDSIMLYPTFLSSVWDNEDPTVITASGVLQYNTGTNEYQIASAEKLANRGEKGNYISLNTKTCSMNGDGIVDLGMDYGNLDIDAVGVVNYNEADEKTTMNLTLRISSILDEKIFENMAKKINDTKGLTDVDFNSTTLEQGILEWTDRETADKIKSDFTLDKKFRRVPRPMRETFVITGVRLESYKKFGDEQVGLKTSVDQAAIVNIYSEPVMKYVPFKLFAEQRTTTGDRLGMMFDIPGVHLYFFDYDNRKTGTMNILTSDKEMMNDINDLKPDKRKERKFMYQTTESSAYQSQFLRIFKQ